jgi:hypothetical protein
MAHMKRIVILLARSHEFPNGSVQHGYELVAPLDADGKIDLDAWKSHRDHCTVRRFWADEEEQHGMLKHRQGGPGGATWIFDYDASDPDDDEAGYRLGDHVWVPGEYVSIKDDEGVMHTFRVASVDPA